MCVSLVVRANRFLLLSVLPRFFILLFCVLVLGCFHLFLSFASIYRAALRGPPSSLSSLGRTDFLFKTHYCANIISLCSGNRHCHTVRMNRTYIYTSPLLELFESFVLTILRYRCLRCCCFVFAVTCVQPYLFLKYSRVKGPK